MQKNQTKIKGTTGKKVKLKVNNKNFVFEENIGGNPISKLKQGRFYEKQMLDFIRSLKPKETIVDVGANIGNHTVYLAALTNCKKVISIEPHPTLYPILKQNIENNHLSKKVKVVNKAAGPKKDKVGLKWEANDKLGGTQVVKGKTTTQDSLDSIAGKEKISVIKIDVEGYESSVLVGAKKILKTQAPAIFVEIWSRAAKKDIDSILNPFGYTAKKVFNSSATYYYSKDKKASGIDSVKYHLSKYRIFRKSS